MPARASRRAAPPHRTGCRAGNADHRTNRSPRPASQAAAAVMVDRGGSRPASVQPPRPTPLRRHAAARARARMSGDARRVRDRAERRLRSLQPPWPCIGPQQQIGDLVGVGERHRDIAGAVRMSVQSGARDHAERDVQGDRQGHAGSDHQPLTGDRVDGHRREGECDQRQDGHRRQAERRSATAAPCATEAADSPSDSPDTARHSEEHAAIDGDLAGVEGAAGQRAPLGRALPQQRLARRQKCRQPRDWLGVVVAHSKGSERGAGGVEVAAGEIGRDAVLFAAWSPDPGCSVPARRRTARPGPTSTSTRRRLAYDLRQRASAPAHAGRHPLPRPRDSGSAARNDRPRARDTVPATLLSAADHRSCRADPGSLGSTKCVDRDPHRHDASASPRRSSSGTSSPLGVGSRADAVEHRVAGRLQRRTRPCRYGLRVDRRGSSLLVVRRRVRCRRAAAGRSWAAGGRGKP